MLIPVVNPTNVTDFYNSAPRALRVTEAPHDGTPQVYIARITGLNDLDVVDVSFAGWDDTPGASALELRTKARRLHAEVGIDLIAIDYLQLMRGDYRSENRVQEISSISRAY